jgi:hypothetical protein
MPTDRQISQLVLQVDANIAVAQRSLNELARTVNQTTGQMNNALGSTERAHGRLNNAFNQSRLAQMELSHVITASVDSYAAGASPIRILTLEMGRLAQAATFLGGEGGGVMGKLGRFMSGPWGIAVLLGVTVLSQLIGKMGEGEKSVADLVEEMRKHAKEAEKSKIADEQWAHSIDGLIERNEKLIKTLKDRLKAEEDVALQELNAGRRDEAAAQEKLQQDKTRLANLERQEQALQQRAPTVGTGQGASPTGNIDLTLLQKQIRAAKEEIVKDEQGIAEAQARIAQNTIQVGEEQGKAAADLSAAVDLWSKRYLSALHGIEQANNGALVGSTQTLTEAYEKVKKGLGDAASAGASDAFYSARNRAKDLGVQLEQGRITVAKYATEMQKLAKSLEAAAEAAKNAKKGTGEFGKQISFADAAEIAKNAGLTVTSGYRSTAKQAALYSDPNVNRPGNPVARPGTSAHEGVNGKWALDIAFADGLTPQKIRKIYGDQGVSLSAVYRERGHYHIEGSRSQAAAEENASKRAEVTQIKQQGAFEQAIDRLNAELLSAQSQLTQDYNRRADIAEQQISADTDKLKDSIQEQLDLGKATGFQQGITEKQAEILRAKADEVDAAKRAAVEQQRLLQKLDSQQATLDQQYGFQTDDLKFADEMAKTAGEHRRIQLEILDIQYAQKQADLQILLAKQQLAGLTEDAARTQAEINNLPNEKAHDVARVQQGTLDPLQQYFSNIPHTAAQINEALQSIEVEGIQGLVNALSHAGEGWEAMRDIAIQVLQDIAAKLIQLGIERMIFSMFGNAILGGGGISAPASFGASFVGGFDPTALAAPLATLPGGFADGGFVSGHGGPTSDSIPAMLSNGEYVMNAAAVQKFGVNFLDMLNEGKVPHKKHGGFLGGLLGALPFALGLLPGLFISKALKEKSPLPLLGMLSPLGFLAGKALFDHHDKASIPDASKIKIPQAANNNTRLGDTYNIHVVAPNTGDPLKDRQTGMQFAAGIEAGLAKKRAKGLAG